MWSTEALQAKLGTLSLDAQAKLEKDAAKKEAKAAAKADAALKKKMVRRVANRDEHIKTHFGSMLSPHRFVTTAIWS